MLSSLSKAHKAGKLQFFGDHGGLADRKAFAVFLRPWATADWVVYAKQPFGGPQEVLRYLSRYTHRVAISNRRLIAAGENGVTFRNTNNIATAPIVQNDGKQRVDYGTGDPSRYTTMTLDPHEFIRRLLMPVLPKGLPRIRHYGFLANGTRADNIAKLRELLSVAPPIQEPESSQPPAAHQACPLPHPCPCCGGRMLIIAFFEPGCEPTHRPSSPPLVVRIDTS